MYALSNHFHSSSCLVTNHRGTSSRDNQRQFGQSVPQKSKPKPNDAVENLKQANLKGPSWRWVPNTSVRKQHVSTWYVDSGCSRHMTGSLELLSSYVNKEGSSVGFWRKSERKDQRVWDDINQVSYVDGLKHNLISLSDNGMDVMFKIKYCIMYKANTLIEVVSVRIMCETVTEFTVSNVIRR
ncbi:LOW QUALITY PROTEIN: hypothetical protein OSB04_024289 [Centaurea solstitialis]|uniref:Retrovirus-related Pol polyprotein from transposon TNT 1-94-like beta-barrel domain-containing protein n=1 Tax=Centaurea solstitialis TaxID=347529 RepID=A0AA38W0H3_9ASTR|nr:LOW QUALITY PROTEIN: hypothetical protein OSB04_024289 [Centaurea solstitialis]